jgi:hypothetical protein
MRDSAGANIRSPYVGVAAPELDGQEDHEEGVGAQVRRVGKVRVEGRRAQAVLQQRQPRRLPAHNGDEAVAQGIPPARQSPGICLAQAHISFHSRRGRLESRVGARTVVVVLVAGVEPLLGAARRGRGGRGRRRIRQRAHLDGRRGGSGQRARAWPGGGGWRRNMVRAGLDGSHGADRGARR